MTRLTLAALVLTLSACTNTTDRMLVSDSCLHWDDHGYWTTILIPQYCGQNCTTYVPVSQYVSVPVCRSSVAFVEANPGYQRATR